MKSMDRRGFLRLAAIGGTGLLAAACQPKIVEVEKVVTQVVKEVVKETVMVKGTPQVVEKIVEKVVEAPTAAAKDKVNIRDIVWGSSAKMVPMYEMFAQSFNEKFPHITVEHIFVPNAQYTARVQTMLAAGDPPEVCSPMGGHINTYRGPDFDEFLDMNPLIEREDYDMTDFHQSSIFSATNPFNQALDGMPVQLFSGMIVYNKDLFAAAGIPEPPHDWNTDDWDYEKLTEIAKQLTVDINGKTAGQPGFDAENIVQYGLYDGAMYPAWGIAWGGVGPQTDGTDRRTVGFDDKFIEGSDYWVKLAFEDHVMPTPYEQESFKGLLNSPFHTGKVAMQMAMTWNVESFLALTEFKFDFAALPHGPARNEYINNRLCMDQATIFSKGKHHEESWEWVKYLSSPEISFRYSVDLRECLPARISDIGKYGERLATRMPEIDGNVVSSGLGLSHYHEFWSPPNGWTEIVNPYIDKVRLNEEPASVAFPQARTDLQANWDEYYSQFA